MKIYVIMPSMSTAEIVKILVDCFDKGNKILICGNGGSSSESDHFFSEFLTHGFRAMSLNNSSVITALANDYSYNEVFSRQLKVIGQKGDVLIGLSTSGKSKNILEAYKIAKKMGIKTIDWPHKTKYKKDNKTIAKIQEEQLELMHEVYIKLLEYY